MDRNAKLIPLSLDDKVKLLHTLEGSIFFQKTLTKTDVHRRMTVPTWFIKEHGDKVRKSILLRTPSSKQSWTVSLDISFLKEVVQVRAIGVWKDFATFHGLLEGDLLIFSLTAISKFEVHLYREEARKTREHHFQHHSQHHSQPTRRSRRFDDANISLSRKKAKHSDEHLAAQGRTQDPATTSDSTLGEEQGNSGGDDFPDGHGHEAHSAVDIAVIHSWSDLKAKSDTRVGPAKQTISRMKEVKKQQASQSLRNSSQPSFFKKLTANNLSNFSKTGTGLKNGILEIPSAFWKTFCIRMHPFVTLQGIGEDSPMRTVTCARHFCSNRFWRLRLTNGWREFALENNLEINQVLQFTLAGNSLFIVRRVDDF